MNKIREKATESEVIVRNITQDIQKLDMAKRNLIQSMTTLKRFQMLGTLFITLYSSNSPRMAANALSQLEELVKQKNYADAAPTLQVLIAIV